MNSMIDRNLLFKNVVIKRDYQVKKFLIPKNTKMIITYASKSYIDIFNEYLIKFTIRVNYQEFNEMFVVV